MQYIRSAHGLGVEGKVVNTLRVAALPRIQRARLARVMATLRRRTSARKPMPDCAPGSLARTHDMMTTSICLPWKLSTVSITTCRAGPRAAQQGLGWGGHLPDRLTIVADECKHRTDKDGLPAGTAVHKTANTGNLVQNGCVSLSSGETAIRH